MSISLKINISDETTCAWKRNTLKHQHWLANELSKNVSPESGSLEEDNKLFTIQTEKSPENKINSKLTSDNLRKKRSISTNYEPQTANKDRFQEEVNRDDNFSGNLFLLPFRTLYVTLKEFVYVIRSHTVL